MCDFFLFFWTDITGLTLAQVQTRDGNLKGEKSLG
jgi:hypothetical protein